MKRVDETGEEKKMGTGRVVQDQERHWFAEVVLTRSVQLLALQKVRRAPFSSRQRRGILGRILGWIYEAGVQRPKSISSEDGDGRSSGKWEEMM